MPVLCINDLVDKFMTINASELPFLNKKARILGMNENSMSIAMDINSDTHFYLSHHIFGKESVIPAVFLLEFLAEAAYFFLQNKFQKKHTWLCSEILSVECKRFFKVPLEATQKLRIFIKFIDYNLPQKDSYILEAQIISDKKNATGRTVRKNVVFLKTHLILSLHFHKLPSSSLDLSNDKIVNINIQNIYNSLRSPILGSLFQTMTGNFIDKENGLVAFIDLKGLEKNYIAKKRHVEAQNNLYITPIGANDSALQVALCFGYLQKTGMLPVSIDKITFFHIISPDSKLVVFVKKISQSNMNMLVDIHVFKEETLTPLIELKGVNYHTAPIQINQKNLEWFHLG